MIEHNNISIKIFESAVKALRLRDESSINIDIFLDDYIDNDIPIKKSVASLLFAYFRNKATIDKIITNFVTSTKPKYSRIIAVALTQMFYQNGIVPESAANIAVIYTKQKYTKRISKFINAVLRNASRTQEEFFDKYNRENKLPQELSDKWTEEYGIEETTKLSDLFVLESPLTFRTIKKIKLSNDDIKRLDAKEIKFKQLDKSLNFYNTNTPSALFAEKWLEEGQIYIQDAATAIAPMSVKIKKNANVLDVCAAPGGKSLIILEKFKCSLTVTDKSEKRLELVKENFLKYDYEDTKIISIDTLDNYTIRKSFDVILLDVPCSNTGVFRKRPDTLWNFSEDKMLDLVKLQREILDIAINLLADKGKLIYSTCSIEKEENENQIRDFIATNSNFKLEKETKLLPTKEHDGCYVAVLNSK